MKIQNFARQASESCGAGKSFYHCYLGAFHGCCSSDPCTTGICADEDEAEDDDAKDDVEQATSVRTQDEDSDRSDRTRDGLLPSSPSSSSTIQPDDECPSSSSSPFSSSSPSSRTGPIVGGALGALGGLALLAALIAWYLSRRKSKKGFSLKIKHQKKASNKEEAAANGDEKPQDRDLKKKKKKKEKEKEEERERLLLAAAAAARETNGTNDQQTRNQSCESEPAHFLGETPPPPPPPPTTTNNTNNNHALPRKYPNHSTAFPPPRWN